MLSFLDLLIVDEAGQASPDLGAAVFALAHKAVVVGDMKQLSPVSGVSPEIDARYIGDRWCDPEMLQILRERGADAGSGSVMRLAATGASRAELYPNEAKLRDGLLLREHYRCATPIINLCIDLLYNDHDRNDQGDIVTRELEPKGRNPGPGCLADADLVLDAEQESALRKRMQGTFPLPPLGFYQTGGPNDQPVKGDSWTNPGEVDAIVSWLQGPGQQLARWHARAEGKPGEATPLQELVAIVTPFCGQALAIKAQIEKRVGVHLAESMTIGTVHTLQGAEKPVVLFSAVNKDSKATHCTDDNHRDRVFIDRDEGRLLNVAISRAQKSFILFGHSELFFSDQAMNPANDLPSAIVGRCLAGVREPEREARHGFERSPGVKLGPTRLLVVESAHKAQLIQGFGLNGIQVFGTGGHIRNLYGAGTVSHAAGLKPKWHFAPGEEVIPLLQRAATRLLQCDELILGMDNDAQGEAIAWHLLDVLKEAPWFAHVKRVRRIRFNEITAKSLQSACDGGVLVTLEGEGREQRMASACKALNMGTAYGALSLRVLDNLIGKVYSNFGVSGGGRVKGPLLRALAGRGEEPGVAGGRFGLGISVQLGELQAPARLLMSDAGGPWAAWSSSDTRQSLRMVSVLAAAQVASEPCLMETDVLKLNSVDSIGTLTILQEAYKRLGFRPYETLQLLQALYEQRELSQVQQQAFTDRLQVKDDTTKGWVECVNGLLELTPLGKKAAQTLLSNVWLQRISASSFLAQFDYALELLSKEPDATLQRYQAFTAEWATKFDAPENGSVPRPAIAGPAGPTYMSNSKDSAPANPFVAQPPISRSSWIEVSAAEGKPFETVQVQDEGTPVEQPESDGARSGAHGALVPLNLSHSLQENAPCRSFTQAEQDLFSLMQQITLASALQPGEVKLIRRIYPLRLADEDAALSNRELGIEITTVQVQGDRGWFDVDPQGLECALKKWASADVEQRLSQPESGTRLKIGVVGGRPRTQSLLMPTIDELLCWMAARELGRPSTFGTHIDALLGGTCEGNATTTNLREVD